MDPLEQAVIVYLNDDGTLHICGLDHHIVVKWCKRHGKRIEISLANEPDSSLVEQLDRQP